MPPNGMHENLSMWLMEQSHRTQHALGQMQAGIDTLRREGADGRKAIHKRIDETRQELSSRLDRIEASKEAPAKQPRDWSWIARLPWAHIGPILALVIASFWVHITAGEWKAVLMAKLK